MKSGLRKMGRVFTSDSREHIGHGNMQGEVSAITDQALEKATREDETLEQS